MKKLLSLTLTILVLSGMSSSAFAACGQCKSTVPTLTYGCQVQQHVFNNGCPQVQNKPDCGFINGRLPDSDEFWQYILKQINNKCDQNGTPDNDCSGAPNCGPNNKPDAEDIPGSDQNNDTAPDSTPNDGADLPQEGEQNNTPDNTPDSPGVNQNPNNTPDSNQGSDQEQTVDQNELYIRQVVSLVNQQRSANGLSAVKLNDTVSAAAQLRAEECAASFSHTRPNGASCFTALREMGVNYSGAAENIAYGQDTPQEVVNAWMNSDGHRKNILNGKYTEIGIGYAVINGTPYWSQFFIY